jgi:hypothetical protein
MSAESLPDPARSRQKSRLLPAAPKPMSAEIAAGDFGQ